MQDLVNAVDGGLGLVVGDMPDGALWVLKRNRKTPGYTLTKYNDTRRSAVIESREIMDRREALNAMSAAIELHERI